MPPTIVVSTGNGAHAWWIFKEPLIFDLDHERQATARLVTRWQTLSSPPRRAWRLGFRPAFRSRPGVLRIPGTVNAKDPKNPKQVTVYSTSDHRYNPCDFEEFLDEAAIPDPEAEERAARDWSERFADKPLIVDLNARIPDDLLQRWMDGDMRFKNTWFRQRHDLRDQSQSGYDLALACFGLNAGLSEQQTVDLLIQHRNLHKQKPRTRIDYFQRTIVKAANRSNCSEQVVVPASSAESSGEATESGPPAENDPSVERPDDPATAKAVLCEQISNALGIRVLRLVKLTGKEPVYRMEHEDGKLEFSSVAKLIDQKSVRIALAGSVGRLIPRIKPKLWVQLAQMIWTPASSRMAAKRRSLKVARGCTSRSIFPTPRLSPR